MCVNFGKNVTTKSKFKKKSFIAKTMRNNFTDRSSSVCQLAQVSETKDAQAYQECPTGKLKKVDGVQICKRPISHEFNARPPINKEHTFVLDRSGKGPSNTAVSIVSRDAPIDSVIRRKSFKDLVSIIDGVLAAKAGGKFLLKLEINNRVRKNTHELNNVKKKGKFFSEVETQSSCFNTKILQTCRSVSVTELTGFVEHPRPPEEIHLMPVELAENYVLKDCSPRLLSSVGVKSKNQNPLDFKEKSLSELFKSTYSKCKQDDNVLTSNYVKKLREDFKEIEKHLSEDRDIISKAINYYKKLNDDSVTKYAVKDLFESQFISHLGSIGYHYRTIKKQIINLLKTDDQQILSDLHLINSLKTLRSKQIKQIPTIGWKGTKMDSYEEMSEKLEPLRITRVSGPSSLQSTSYSDEQSDIKSTGKSSVSEDNEETLELETSSNGSCASDTSCNSNTSTTDTSIVLSIKTVGKDEKTDKSKTVSEKALSEEAMSERTPKSESTSADEPPEDCLQVYQDETSGIIEWKDVDRLQKADAQLKIKQSLISSKLAEDKAIKKRRLLKNCYNPLKKKDNFRPIKLYIFNRRDPEQDRTFLKMIKNQPVRDDSNISVTHHNMKSNSNPSIKRKTVKLLCIADRKPSSFNGKNLRKNSFPKLNMPKKWNAINISDRSLAHYAAYLGQEKNFSKINIVQERSDLSKSEWKHQVTTVLERINRKFHICHDPQRPDNSVDSAFKSSSPAENCFKASSTYGEMTSRVSSKSTIPCKKRKTEAKRACLLM
ncbi:uncharacterized protein LOC106669942 [Cimex lectularius]|uniref:Uncharacterized protein n=1 Tax=Cimex lectularius TaxID=79782 RepID=A0A8I6RZF7_CIMLE|nr:uncharacterized protein LOC106669942 [Cimex lectularius]